MLRSQILLWSCITTIGCSNPGSLHCPSGATSPNDACLPVDTAEDTDGGAQNSHQWDSDAAPRELDAAMGSDAGVDVADAGLDASAHPSAFTELDCPNGFLDSRPRTLPAGTLGRDWVSLPHGATHVYCVEVPEPSRTIAVSVADRTGFAQCLDVTFTLTAPPGSGLAPRTVTAGEANYTHRFWGTENAPVPAGIHLVTVQDDPSGVASCNQKYMVFWSSSPLIE